MFIKQLKLSQKQIGQKMYNFRGKKEKLCIYFLLNSSQNSNKNIVLAAVQFTF